MHCIFARAAHVFGGAAEFAVKIFIKVVMATTAAAITFIAAALQQHTHVHVQQTQATIELLPPAERVLITPVPESLVIQEPLNNQLALISVCWQAFASVTESLKSVKASEMKAIASQLEIPKYRNMNKSQLLVAIAYAQIAAS